MAWVMVKFVRMNEQPKKPLILVVNDDGVMAKGIRALAEVMIEFGEVVLVAPDKPQSGMGHAVTLHNPIRLQSVHYALPVHSAYACSGTPVDAVKLAIAKILHRKPDLVVSGINHGSNSSINVIYSGTMSAAMEGAVEGIPSIGFSLLDHSADADFDASQEVAKTIVANALQWGIPSGVCLNVNIPQGKKESIKGIKMCTQSRGFWDNDFDERTDPAGKKYFWMTGDFRNPDEREGNDEMALRNGYVSVVPVQFDLTAYHTLPHFQQWNLK